ncbi:MAG TPA: hypothetical protein V6D23_23470 [Candidatus Obscuribacterales bacterium]
MYEWQNQLLALEADNVPAGTLADELYTEAIRLLQCWAEEGFPLSCTLSEATRSLSRVMRFRRRDVRPVLAMAWVFLALGDQVQARQYLQRALSLEPAHPLLASFLRPLAVKPQLEKAEAESCRQLLAECRTQLAKSLPVIDGSGKTQSRLRQEIEVCEAMGKRLSDGLDPLPAAARQLQRELNRQLQVLHGLLADARLLQSLERRINEDYARVSQAVFDARQNNEASAIPGFEALLVALQDEQRDFEIQLGLLTGHEIGHLESLLGDLETLIHHFHYAVSASRRQFAPIQRELPFSRVA